MSGTSGTMCAVACELACDAQELAELVRLDRDAVLCPAESTAQLAERLADELHDLALGLCDRCGVEARTPYDPAPIEDEEARIDHERAEDARIARDNALYDAARDARIERGLEDD